MLDAESQNNYYINLGKEIYDWNKVGYSEIKEDLIFELQAKYGNPDLINSSKSDGSIIFNIDFTMFYRDIIWKNKNSVDIILRKCCTSEYEGETTANLTLIYSYSDEMTVDLIKRKSDF